MDEIPVLQSFISFSISVSVCNISWEANIDTKFDLMTTTNNIMSFVQKGKSTAVKFGISIKDL